MTEYNDLTEEKARKLAEELIGKGATIWVKWKCLKCKERVTSDTPNAFFTEGYTHTIKENGDNCNFTSFPTEFGLMVIFGFK